MSTPTPTDQLADVLERIVTQNRYAALQNMRLIYNYDLSMNIEHWLRLFDAKADCLFLGDQMKMDQLPSYLPINIAQWLLSNDSLRTWKDMKKALIDTFGIPQAHQKQLDKNKLEGLNQGALPSRQFKAFFESILQELPSPESTFSKEILRSIYMRTMNPRLLDNIVASITADSSWRQVADWTINKEDVFNADPRLAEQLGGAPSASAPANSLLSTGVIFRTMR
ncbi:hypothetical protein G6F38_013085 [Rhizopus arrhizus]|nr:hypothetical protein G6F38_013085 [Rhizopus arrhizus]